MMKHVNTDIDCCYQCPNARRSCRNGKVRIVCHARSLKHPRKVIPRIESFPHWCHVPDVLEDGYNEFFCLSETEVARANCFKKMHLAAGCKDDFEYSFRPKTGKITIMCWNCDNISIGSLMELADAWALLPIDEHTWYPEDQIRWRIDEMLANEKHPDGEDLINENEVDEKTEV